MEVLERWAGAAPAGRALDLGSGDGGIALWLGRQGFVVDAVEVDRGKTRRLSNVRRGLPVVVHSVDLREFPLVPGTYSLIVASSILHFLRPTELWPLADRLEAALMAQGLLIAEALTVDDPEAVERLASGEPQIEPNTFSTSGPEGVIHFFEADELRRVFGNLEVLEYQENRRLAPDSPRGYRSGATFVGRRTE
ncbi:MAG TPA: methyltransferase domain-containing protein [Anaerolineales bacterium]|nr:methyltransferase domain-containing protein [Anaerolineales bacterium]